MIIPTFVVSFCYFKIIHFIMQHTRTNICLNREDLKAQRMKDNRKTVRILMPVLIAFLVCVLPTIAKDVYYAHRNNQIDFDLHRGLTILERLTYPLHACVNPIIYTIMDRRFRADLLIMLGLKKREVRKDSKTTSNFQVQTVQPIHIVPTVPTSLNVPAAYIVPTVPTSPIKY